MEFSKWKVQGLDKDHKPDGDMDYFTMFNFTESEAKQLGMLTKDAAGRYTIRFNTTDEAGSDNKAREIFEHYLRITDGK